MNTIESESVEFNELLVKVKDRIIYLQNKNEISNEQTKSILNHTQQTKYTKLQNN